MAYDFYCTHCGKQLSQDTVLFDMQYLLTRDKEKKFQLLKFRMTQKELRKLIESVPADGTGFHKCTISFKQIMAIIGNEHNLCEDPKKILTDKEGNQASDADIASLTLAQIDEYLSDDDFGGKKKKKEELDDPFGEWDDIPNEGDEERKAEKEAAKRAAAAIIALEDKDRTNTDKSYTKFILRPDLQILRGLFAQGETFEFSIRPQEEEDNEHNKVLVGYDLAFGGNIGHLSVDARVCDNRECGAKVFKHAGTAKHQAVAFIGYQSAGKTSTILALAHYARHGMTHNLAGYGDKAADIWNGAKVLGHLDVELVDKDDPRLAGDMDKFTDGVAPNKTEAGKRSDAYCATFRIKDQHQAKYYLLTLTDLPGELCNMDGTIQKERIHDHFPVAMTCDAFVACFDTSKLGQSGNLVDFIENVCHWTENFQQMRAEHNQVATYVPTMLLFTKCQELEAGREPEPNNEGFVRPEVKMFCLYDEKMRIKTNGVYEEVLKSFDKTGRLPKAYHAMMRCSPFGYMAPSENDLKGPNKDNFTQHAPTPKNIDRLMFWLLCVSGCLPTDVCYKSPQSPAPYTQTDYYLTRPQLRDEVPAESDRVKEAMVRCTLFENPGKFDRGFVTKHDSWAQKAALEVDARIHPRGNSD